VESNLVSKPKIAISRLDKPLNISANAKMVNFVVLVIAPSRIKKTKSSLEISRTFGTIFTKPEVRADLMEAGSVEGFCDVLKKFCFEPETQISENGKLDFEEKDGKIDPSKRVIYDALNIPLWHFGKGIYYDLKNRYPDYVSDWTDGVRDLKSCGKSLSAAVFIYFACLLPSIAFGNLNAASTDNWLTVERTLISQTIGGLVFGFFSTQPIVILLTTAPIAIYITIIRDLAEPLGTDLKTLYTLVGLWNVAFLVIYACFNLSKLMRYSTRSVEEVFGIFIACAFTKDAVKHIMYSFEIIGTSMKLTELWSSLRWKI
jgi:sodium borate transporter 11